MKKFMLSILLTLAVVFGANAQEKTGAKVSGGTQAQITFQELEHDYGTIKKGADGVCEFVYKNTGKAPLMLTNVRSSCGCTVPSWSKEPLMPGQSAIIKVKYNTNNVGPIHKTITVESNAAGGRTVLKIKGKVVNN